MRYLLVAGALGLFALSAAGGWLHANDRIDDRSPAARALVKAGPWYRDKEQAMYRNPLDIARVARFGPFPVLPSEVTYLWTNEASTGERLRAGSDYRVCGPAPNARFWSLTAYTDEGYFFPNAERRFSVSSESLRADGQTPPAPGEPICLTVGPAASGARAIHTSGEGGVSLILRLYQSADGFLETLDAGAVPSIEAVTP